MITDFIDHVEIIYPYNVHLMVIQDINLFVLRIFILFENVELDLVLILMLGCLGGMGCIGVSSSLCGSFRGRGSCRRCLGL